jgi:hypothetical protein
VKLGIGSLAVLMAVTLAAGVGAQVKDSARQPLSIVTGVTAQGAPASDLPARFRAPAFRAFPDRGARW